MVSVFCENYTPTQWVTMDKEELLDIFVSKPPTRWITPNTLMSSSR